MIYRVDRLMLRSVVVYTCQWVRVNHTRARISSASACGHKRIECEGCPKLEVSYSSSVFVFCRLLWLPKWNIILQCMPLMIIIVKLIVLSPRRLIRLISSTSTRWSDGWMTLCSSAEKTIVTVAHWVVALHIIAIFYRSGQLVGQ